MSIDVDCDCRAIRDARQLAKWPVTAGNTAPAADLLRLRQIASDV
jgi:hypothetical protein